MKGLIFNIKKFSIFDGPGIRTTVFIKGCPLSCPWCQNPEGLNKEKKINYNYNKCISCYQCINACSQLAINKNLSECDKISINSELCNKCGDCVEACPTNALQFDSEWMTCDVLMKEILKDKIFYDVSGGGITFSGGDPLYQHDFIFNCIKQIKNYKIHVAIETSCMVSWEVIEPFIELTDLFILDLKIINPELHKKIIGGDINIIKSNIKKLSKSHQNILIRTPLIPGYTSTKKNLEGIAKFLKEIKTINKRIKFELLNFNPLAKSKYKTLKIPYDPVFNKDKYSPAEIEEFYRIIHDAD